MDLFWKVIAGVLISIVLNLALGKHQKDISTVLSIIVCVLTLIAMFHFLEPILNFLREMQDLASLNAEAFSILMNAVGIGIITEIASSLCVDAGNTSEGRTLQLFGSIVVFWYALPLFREFIGLLQDIIMRI